jgi:ABC-type transport system involved in cytochrome c biogenesis permease subunit
MRTVLRENGLPEDLVYIYMALIESPRERTMGDLQRIFYFHVPAGITIV